MGEAYKNKEWNDIRKDVKKEFKAIEDREESFFKHYRDDQQIYSAGVNIIDRYIKNLSNADNIWVDKKIWNVENWEARLKKLENQYKQEALQLFKVKRKKFCERWNQVIKEKNILWSSAYITSSSENEQQLNEVASAINAAEDEALRKIKFELNPKQDNDNAVEDSSVRRDKSWKVVVEWNEIVRQKPMFEHDKKTWLLTFTDRVNPLKIHTVLWPLFKNEKTIYQIDYTNCKNEKIKQKMMALTWWEAKCLISFNKEKWTYLIRNSKWQEWEDRALIWEWVTLKRWEIIQREAREKKKSQNEQLWNVDANENDQTSPENDPKLKKYVEKIPSSLREKLSKLWNTEYRRFIIQTENRLTDILKQWKAENYELETEAVSKRYWAGLMEIHFVNQHAEKDITVWEDESVLWEKLYDLLDGNEDEYKEYLTTRVKEKWEEFDDLTLRENGLAWHERTDLKDEEKLSMEKYQSINNWIRMLNRFIDEHRQTEWDSWLDNWDKYLASIVRKVRDLEYTIKESLDTVSATDIEIKITEVAISIAKDWDDYIHDTTTYKETFQRRFKEVFLWTKEEQISAIRYLSRNESWMDRTESSFLSDEIVTSRAVAWEEWVTEVEWEFEVNNAELNEYFKNINNWLLTNLEYDESWKLVPNEKTKNIDELYNASGDTTWEGVINVLIAKNMIPETWRNNSDVKDRARELAKTLRDQMKIVESYTVETIREWEAKEKLELEMKSNKTEADIQRLQALNYLENHPDEAAELHEQVLQKTKDEIKYWWVNNIVRRALASVFVEEWDWAKWANADIYNDIVWYWAFDLSDENAKIMWEILVEIAITVAIAVATGWMWAAAMAWLLRVCATWARAARWVNTANRIRKVVLLTKRGYRSLNTAWKVAKFGVEAPWLLLEGTIFNNASKTVHAALKWTSLDSLNLNPLTRENLETAAFLCALNIWNQIAWKSFKIFDGSGKLARTKLKLKPSDTLKSIWKTMNEAWAEMAGMLIATEGINLTFWHEVVDPITWEVENVRELAWPSNEEWATMIGMIIAFRAVQPGMRRKLTEKLNDWTLVVCRTKNRKEPAIRNVKTWEIILLKNLPNQTGIIESWRQGTWGESGEWPRERRWNGTEERRPWEEERRPWEEERRPEERTDRDTEADEQGDVEIDINKTKEDLRKRESELASQEAECSTISRMVDRLKRKGESLTEKEKERLQKLETQLEKRNQDIAKLKEEIQKFKDIVEKYEASQSKPSDNEWESNYFNWKRSKFNISEEVARSNSEIMDKMMESNNPNDLAFMRDTISIQYKTATWKDCPELTDQQLRTIIEAHKQLWELWNLTQWELLRKVRVLSENITDANFRRFLLESWFCWRWWRKWVEESFRRSLVDRDQFADTISKNRREKWWYPKWKIEIRKWQTLSVDRFFKKHPDLKAKYEEALKIQDEGERSRELSKIDVELAEQRILESWRAIEFWVGKTEKAEASYKALNEVYNWKVEKIVREDGSVVLRLKVETAPSGWEIVPKWTTEVVKTEPSLLDVIDGANLPAVTWERLPAVIWERLPATIKLKWWEIVPTEKVMPPAVREKLNNALAVIEKRGWLPAVIEKNPEIIPVVRSKWIIPPYWLVPFLLIPWLHWAEGEEHSVIMQLPDDFSHEFDKLEENPKITGVELPTDITWPFDARWDMPAIKSEIDSKFADLLRENHIEEPLKDNALILLRGVSSWTYKWNWDWAQYNENLSLKRAEEFKKYLMQKYPELTDNNFVLDSFYQPSNIDEDKRFQWVSMWVVDMQKYWWIGTITHLIPSGQDWRVL